ncbi:siderophore iron transporter [Microthyrium microscopicum]|uniref:Siderophore iron transporter n=1 Tax=Microthyrium microscopicum TaxID=703497 RepID=A0A6A6UC66_9PEZI|nr:siderophore iron transporter [Microthyrium microscopicum]
MAEEKETVTRHNDVPAEHGLHHSITANTDTIIGFEADLGDLPKGYYRSKLFLGSMFATGMGLWAAVSTFGMVAPVIGYINADIGPSASYVWISIIYNVVLAVSLAPIGRLSDIFGRRYFFIGGGVIAVIGCIVCATAKTIPVLIGGNVLLGISTATQLCFHFVMGELVPMKYRYTGGAILYLFGIPGSGFGPAMATSFITKYPSVGWRAIYWLLLAGNVVALICWILFYFPPSFHKKHRNDIDSKMYWVKNFDYIGLALFTCGFVAFLLGLSWGGATYPWKSAAVIVSIVGGFAVLVVFVLYEIYAPQKEPLLPVHLFRNGHWVASCVLLGLGAGVYYAFAIIWPMQVAVLYGDGRILWVGLASCINGLSTISGQFVGGMLANKIGKTRFQCSAMFLIGGTFLGCAAVSNPYNFKTAIALIFMGCFFIGWNETICLANSTIVVHDQRYIGIAGGLAGSMRSGITSVIIAIYVSILTNKLTSNVASMVPAALTSAGLPATSVTGFITALGVGTPAAFDMVPGINSTILAAGSIAYKEANAGAYRTVYLSTIAFSVLGLALTFFAPNTEKHMTGKVAATLGNEDDTVLEKKQVDHLEEE